MRVTKTTFSVAVKRNGKIIANPFRLREFSTRNDAQDEAAHVLRQSEGRMVYEGDGAEAQRRYILERVFPDDALIFVPFDGDFASLAASYPDCVGVIETRHTNVFDESPDHSLLGAPSCVFEI